MKRPERRGRDSKIALRAAPISEEINPIKPGLIGGSYKPISDSDIKKLYNLALDALSEIGIGLAPKSGINYMTKAGAVLGDDGRIRFSKSLVEDMIALSSKDLTLFGREDKFDMHLSGKKVFFWHCRSSRSCGRCGKERIQRLDSSRLISRSSDNSGIR